MRRGWLVVVAALIVLAGCNAGPGDRTPQPIEASASEATVSEAGLSESGFSESGVERVRVNRSGTLSISGDVEMDLGYQVRATGWRAQYRAADSASVFNIYTVPLAKPERVDARIDPLGDQSLADVVAGAGTTYRNPEDLEHVRNRTVTVLETETTVQEFEGTATTDDGSADVTVYVTTVDHDSDRVRAVGIAPRDADTWETMRTLFESISH